MVWESFKLLEHMMNQWRFKISEEFVFVSRHLMGVFLKNDWVVIDDGIIRIQPEYAWDGCTPTIDIPCPGLPKGLWIGIWNGPLGEDCRPVSWQATLIHDALCQFRLEIQGLTKKKTLSLFKETLRLNDAPDWMISFYPWAINRYGPQEWGGPIDILPDLKD